MFLVRLLVAVALVSAACGCQAIKDDPMIGDHPWQPGSSTPIKDAPR